MGGNAYTQRWELSWLRVKPGKDQSETSRPEAGGQRLRASIYLTPGVDVVRRRHEPYDGLCVGTPLDLIYPLHSTTVGRIRSKPVDRVRRVYDQAAAPQDGGSLLCHLRLPH